MAHRTSILPRFYGCALLLGILWVSCPKPAACQFLPPAITSPNNTTFTVATSGTFTVTATGNPTPSLSEAGALPSGVSFNATTGVLSGIPGAGTTGTYPLTFTAQNMGIAPNVLIQKKDTYFANGSGAASESLTLGSSVSSTDLLFCMAGWETGGGSLISSVTDSLGNTYSALPLVVHSPHQMQGFYAFSAASGADTVKVNFNGAGGTYVGVACAEWSGPTQLDVHAEGIGTGATPASAAVTPSAAGELLIGYADDSGNNWSANGAWTLISSAIYVRYGLEDQLSSTTSPTTSAFTIGSAPWAAGVVAFSSSSIVNVTQNFTLTVNQAPAITSANSTTFTVGSAGLFTVTATGTPAPTFSETGALPTGVTFNPSTGALSGTPAAATGGTYPITITAQNGVGTAASQSFTMNVNQVPAITSANNTTFSVGAAGSFTITATGTPAATFSETGALPTGVILNATSGVLSGTPAASGSYPLTISAHNGVGSDATQNFTLTVTPYQAPAITSANNTTFTVSTSGSFTVTATGSPTPTLGESGALPSGVSFNAANGVLSGIPGAGTTGTYPLTFTAQNMASSVNTLIQKKDTYFANGSGAASESLTLGSSVSSTDLLFCMAGWETGGGSLISSVTDSLGNTYSALPLVVHSPHQMQGFYAFSAASGADTVTVNFNGTGGTYVGVACAEWSGPTQLDVHAEGIGTGATPASAAVTPSAAGELLIGYADDSGNNWSANGAWTLISSAIYVRYGLEDQLSSTTSPTASAFTIGSAPWAAGVVAFSSSTSATQNFTLTVSTPSVPPAITSASSTTFTVGAAGSFTVTATGFPAPTLSESGALPSGVTFNATTGVLGGTPAATSGGIYPITITAQNGAPPSALQSFTLTVNQASAITSANNTAFTVGAAGSFTVTATGNPTPTLSESGALPSGVTFNATTGVVSGTPAAATGGTYPITITAQNGVGTAATQNFTLTVNQAPAITSASSTTFTVGAAGSFTVTATGFPAPTLSESGALPSGVTFNATTGVLGGTPATTSGGIYPITITAQNGVGTAATQSFTLNVNQAPAITSANNTAFTVGAAGSFTVTATGNPTPTLSESGALPSGVTFNATTGVVSGTPAAATGGTYPITITAQNGVGTAATQNFTLTVNQAPAIISANSTTFTVGSPGLFTITATGTPAATFSETGALPTGVMLNATSGVLSGTPAASGSYPLTISAHNGVGSDATQNFTLTVTPYQAPAITSANNTTFTVSTSGSFTVTATGSPTPTLGESGALPSGVSFNAANGVLSGIPGAGTTGTYPLTFTAQNMGIAPNVLIQKKDTYFANGSGAASESLTLGSSVSSTDLLFCMAGWETGGGSLISSVTDSLGNTYSALPLVVHSPHQMQGFYAFSATSGADTVKVNFNGTGGTYVGMACAEWSGPTQLDVHAEGIGTGATPASAAVTPSAAGELLIGYADDSGNNWSAGSPWTLLSTATGVRYGLEEQLSSTTSPTASAFTISSAVWAAGIASFSSSGTISTKQNFTLTVSTPSVPPSITSANNTTFTSGIAGSFTVTATGFPAPTLSESGALPSGVTFNATTGVLGGTPATTSGGIYPITITAQNGVGTAATQSFTLNVNQAPAITSANNTAFTVGAAGSFTVTATGNPTPTLSESGALPSGVTFNATTGVVSGTPAAATGGTYPITITAQNGVGTAATQNFTLTVNQAPAIISANSTTFTVGSPGLFTVTATGTPAATFSETGALPTGVMLNATSGVLSGTPAASGSYPLTISAHNGVGSDATQNFTLTVTPYQAPAITSANNTTFTVSTSGSFTVTATGSPTPTLGESGALPSGVSFNAANGVLSGIPGAGTTGTYPLTFTAQNMGIAPNVLIQKKDTYFANGSGAAAESITLGSSVSSTDLLFCMAGWETGGGSLISSVTDSLGNTYSALPLVVHSPHQMQGFYAFSAASGADTVKVNFNGTGGTYVGMACAEWSGPTQLDVHAEGIGTGATPASAAVTPSAAGELLIGYADDSGNNWSAGSPWTLLSTATGVRYGLEEQLSSTTTPTASAFTISTAPWAAGVAAFSSFGTISAKQNFTLTVSTPSDPISITSASSTTFTVGAAGSFTVTATGIPTPTLSESGALPSGVTFNATTGVLAGTPAATTGGIYPVTIIAQNGVAPSVTQNFTLNVNEAPTITSFSHAKFIVGTSGSFTVKATGFPVPTFSGTGALPSGVTFNTTTGVLAGTPAANTAGDYPITFMAQNGVGNGATKAFTLTVNQTPAFTSANNVVFGIGVAGSFNVTATGSPAPTLSESGFMPSGITFNPSTGLLSGTPAVGTGGDYALTFTANNGVGAGATQYFTLYISQAPAITSSSTSTFYIGAFDAFTVTTSGIPVPTLSETGVLPSGVTFNTSTGILSGTSAPGTSGNYQITFTAQNGVGTNGTQSFTLIVAQGAGAPVINSPASTSFVAGNFGSFTVTATGSPTPTLSELGAMPSGVNFNAATGVLSGTPGLGTAGAYPITFTAQDTGSVSNVLIQKKDTYFANGSGAASESLTLGSSVSSTDLLFCMAGWEVGGGSLISSVTDSLGNTYSALPLVVHSPHQMQGFYAFSAASGADTVKVNFNGAGGTYVGVACAEWSGPTQLDVHAEGIGTGATPASAAVTPSAAGELLIGYADDSGNNWSAGSPWTLLSTATGVRYGLEDQLSSTTSPTASAFTISSAVWAAGIASFSSSPSVTQNFTLMVSAAPIITTQPSNQAVAAGQTATFMVAVSGTTPLAYQWQLNGANITGANSSTYITPVTSVADNQSMFNVVVTNAFGSAVSSVVTLTVNVPPSIGQQPVSQTVAVGEGATFSVTASGTAPLNYQWSKNSIPIPNSNSPSYTAPSVTSNDNGSQFSVVVTNAVGSASSNSASASVIPHNSPAIYYVDSISGLDTNDGVSKNMPWQNAPGMSACSFNCMAYTLQPGDQVIFKGGVTWTANSFPMVIIASGTSTNPIYFGVDTSWFTGTTWSRPVFDLVEGTFSVAPVLVASSNFVKFDNLEIKNEEVDNSGSWPPRSSISVDGGSNIAIQNCYIHGWSIQNPVPGSDISPTGGIAFYDASAGGIVQNCVFDGSPESDSGVAIYGGSSIQGNVIENVPNGIVVTDPAANVTGNQIFEVPYSVDPSTSSNAMVVRTSGAIYNNIIHDLVPGASALFLEARSYSTGNTQYVYNNLVWNVGDNAPVVIATDTFAPNTTSNQFVYNNTLSGGTASGCVSVIPSPSAPVNLTVQNNHCISELPSSQAWCWNNAGGNFNCGAVSNLTFGNNVLMTTETAAAQGYTLANSFQPLGPSDSTVSAGVNLVASCVTIGSTLCNDLLGVARPGGTLAWDAGAYQDPVNPNSAPSITLQPIRQEVTAGQTATFTVIAVGPGVLTYQWQKNGAAISGATSSTYTSPATSATDNGSVFSVVITNTIGSVTSSPAILSVNSVPGQLIASLTSLAFGNVNIGAANSVSVTFTNTSNSFITISNTSISGPGFSASGIPSGLILAPGESAVLNVIFAPAGTGSVSSSVIVSSDATGSPITIPLSGAGVVPPHSVTLTWNPSTDSVFGYYVYRELSPFGPFIRLNSTPNATTQYTDVTVQPGQTYFYWVTAVEANTVEGPLSQPVTAIVPMP